MLLLLHHPVTNLICHVAVCHSMEKKAKLRLSSELGRDEGQFNSALFQRGIHIHLASQHAFFGIEVWTWESRYWLVQKARWVSSLPKVMTMEEELEAEERCMVVCHHHHQHPMHFLPDENISLSQSKSIWHCQMCRALKQQSSRQYSASFKMLHCQLLWR